MRARPLRHAATALLAVAALALPTVPAVGRTAAPTGGYHQAVAVRSPNPPPHAVVEAGPTAVSADVRGGQTSSVQVDGVDVGPLGTPVDLAPGPHTLAVVVDGVVARSWPVHAAGVRVAPVGDDPLVVARQASGSGGPARPVLLVNPGRPELALSAGPLGAALGALVLPTGQADMPEATVAAIAEVRGPGDPVVVLGGLDAVGPDVTTALADAGWVVERVGSGTAAEVAAAAADRVRAARVYSRDGRAVPAPAVVAPAEPLTGALRAAVAATARGAALVLADADGLPPQARDALAGRAEVLLGPGLTADVVDEVRAAAVDATVGDLPAGGLDGAPTAVRPLWVVDGDVAPGLAALVARAAVHADVAVTAGDAADRVARSRPAAVSAVGQVAPEVVRAWWVDGPDAPAVTASVDPADPTVVLQADRPVDGAAVHVTVHGVEWDGRTAIEGDRVVWTAGPRPSLPPGLEPSAPTSAPLAITAAVAARGHLRHVAADGTAAIAPLTSTSPEGFTVAGGQSAVVGSGPLRTFSVELAPGTGLDLSAVTAEVESILLDPTRGWTARGARSLQRVGTSGQAGIRVVIAPPSTVDAYCRRVGLDTGGRLSCWDGRRTMLNLTRWNTGVAPFHTDLTVYRQYLVSHEVGHGLGFGHVSCPGRGQIAPVMMQQSKGLGGCVANGWPYPHG